MTFTDIPLPLPGLEDDGDALHPGLGDPTPLDEVYKLDRTQREQRVTWLMKQSTDIYNMGVDLAGGREIVANVVLYSGGNDSTTLAHLMRHQGIATHAAHANTGTGVEETIQFVRDTCEGWGLPLIEKHPPTSYEELVLERGFPGPAMHFKMYTRLKERCLEQVRNELITTPRKQRVIFIAGRRRAESARRSDIPLTETKGSVVWVSPLAMWHKEDMRTYRLMMRDVPVNPVAETLGMSGECRCGAFAKPGEQEEVRKHYPKAAAYIDELEEKVKAAGIPEPFCRWGHGQGKPTWQTGPMCTSCKMPDPLFELMEKEAA